MHLLSNVYLFKHVQMGLFFQNSLPVLGLRFNPALPVGKEERKRATLYRLYSDYLSGHLSGYDRLMKKFKCHSRICQSLSAIDLAGKANSNQWMNEFDRKAATFVNTTGHYEPMHIKQLFNVSELQTGIKCDEEFFVISTDYLQPGKYEKYISLRDKYLASLRLKANELLKDIPLVIQSCLDNIFEEAERDMEKDLRDGGVTTWYWGIANEGHKDRIIRQLIKQADKQGPLPNR